LSDGRMVFRRVAGYEYGKSDRRDVFATKRDLVGGSVGARRISYRHVSVCATDFLVALARGAQADLSAAHDDRRGLPSRSAGDFVFRGWRAPIRRRRFGCDDRVRLSDVSCAARCLGGKGGGGEIG